MAISRRWLQAFAVIIFAVAHASSIDLARRSPDPSNDRYIPVSAHNASFPDIEEVSFDRRTPNDYSAPGSNSLSALPWWIEQYRVRGEQAHLWMTQSGRHDSATVFSPEEANQEGWFQRIAASDDAGIQFSLLQYGPPQGSFIGLPSTARQGFFGNAIQSLQIISNAQHPQALTTYWTREVAGHIVADLTAYNDYKNGYLWSIKSSSTARSDIGWPQVAYVQWESALTQHPHLGITVAEAAQNLHNVVMTRVNTPTTLAVVYWILSVWGKEIMYMSKESNLVPAWSDDERGRIKLPFGNYAVGRKAAAAVLGTPTGLKVAKLFGQHQDKFGPKVLDSITIFKDAKCADITSPNFPECEPTLIFTFRRVSRTGLHNCPNVDTEFPDNIPLWPFPGLGNPYYVLAERRQPTKAQWEEYFDHALAPGEGIVEGEDITSPWSNGPGSPSKYYGGPDGNKCHTGFLRGNRYALPRMGQVPAGPDAGNVCGQNIASAHDPGVGSSGGGLGNPQPRDLGDDGGDNDQDAEKETGDDSMDVESEDGSSGDGSQDAEGDAKGNQ